MIHISTITPMKGLGELTSISSFGNTIVYHYSLKNSAQTAMFYSNMTDTNELGTFKQASSSNAKNLGNDAQSVCFTGRYGYDTDGSDVLSTMMTYSSSTHSVYQHRITTAGTIIPSCHNAD